MKNILHKFGLWLVSKTEPKGSVLLAQVNNALTEANSQEYLTRRYFELKNQIADQKRELKEFKDEMNRNLAVLGNNIATVLVEQSVRYEASIASLRNSASVIRTGPMSVPANPMYPGHSASGNRATEEFTVNPANWAETSAEQASRIRYARAVREAANQSLLPVRGESATSIVDEYAPTIVSIINEDRTGEYDLEVHNLPSNYGNGTTETTINLVPNTRVEQTDRNLEPHI